MLNFFIVTGYNYIKMRICCKYFFQLRLERICDIVFYVKFVMLRFVYSLLPQKSDQQKFVIFLKKSAKKYNHSHQASAIIELL